MKGNVGQVTSMASETSEAQALERAAELYDDRQPTERASAKTELDGR